MKEEKKIILFDGVCNLCNHVVQFVIKRDSKDVFRFASLQSDLGKKLIQERSVIGIDLDSIILIAPGVAYYTKSDAALEISKDLNGGWSIFSVFLWLPKGFRDFVYDFIARNRYKWYGKKNQCMIPTADLKAKFLN